MNLNEFLTSIGVPYCPVIERFYLKIRFSENCWTWQGADSGSGRGGGYGRFKVCGKTVAAHRFIYKKINGPIDKRFHIDHKCNNRKCVRPDHLQACMPSTNQKLKYKRMRSCDQT